MVSLYNWQKECLEKWKNNQYKGIAEVTTGGGKTMLASVATYLRYKELEGKLKTYVVVPRIALLEQWKNTMLGVGLSDIIISPTKAQKPKISIFTVNKAREVLPLLIEDEMKKKINVLLILDEFHHYASPANYHLFDFLNSPYFSPSLYSSIGLSATIEVKGLKDKLIPSIGPIIYQYNLNKAINDNIVNNFFLFNISVPMNIEERDEYDTVSEAITKLQGILFKKAPFLFKQRISIAEKIERLINSGDDELKEYALSLQAKILQRRDIIIRVDSRLKTTLTIIKNLKHTDKIIIFTERIDQVNALHKMLKEEKIGSLEYTSEMDKETKKRNLYKFKNSEERILIAFKALDEGLDVPSCNIGIFLATTDTKLQRIQRSGRVLRKEKDKMPSVLYYLYVDRTIENCTLFSNLGDDIIASTGFVNSKGEIVIKEYYKRINFLLSCMKKKKITQEERKKIRTLIIKGAIRMEQFLDKDTLLKLKKEAIGEEKALISLMLHLDSAKPFSLCDK